MAYKAETYHLNLMNSHFIDYLSLFAMKQKKKHSFIVKKPDERKERGARNN